MRGRGRRHAARKPYTLSPKSPNSGWHAPKDRARRSHVARGHTLSPRADTCCALVFQNTRRFQSAPIKTESVFKVPSSNFSLARKTKLKWGDSKDYTQTADKCAHVTVACPTCAWPPPPAPPPALPPPPLADDDHAAGLAGLLVLLATTTINMLLTL